MTIPATHFKKIARRGGKTWTRRKRRALNRRGRSFYQRIGRKGGKQVSPRKAQAVRCNGRKHLPEVDPGYVPKPDGRIRT